MTRGGPRAAKARYLALLADGLPVPGDVEAGARE